MPPLERSSIRDAVLSVVARECGVAPGSIALDRPLGELLAMGSALPAGPMAFPGAVPEEFRVCLLVAAVEDAVGVDLVDHPEFGRFWTITVRRFIELVENART